MGQGENDACCDSEDHPVPGQLDETLQYVPTEEGFCIAGLDRDHDGRDQDKQHEFPVGFLEGSVQLEHVHVDSEQDQ